MNNNFRNQPNWSHNNYQTTRPNFGRNNYYDNSRPNNHNYNNQRPNYGNNRFNFEHSRTNFGFQNRFNHHSNMNNYNSRNDPQFNSNQGNYNSFNHNRNNPLDNKFVQNQFNRRTDQDNFDPVNNFNSQSISKQYFKQEQDNHSRANPHESKEDFERYKYKSVENENSSHQKYKSQFDRQNDFSDNLSNKETKPNLKDLKKKVNQYQSKSRSVEETKSKGAVKSIPVSVKSEPTDSLVKSEPRDIPSDSNKEHDTEDPTAVIGGRSRPVRSSRRTNQEVKHEADFEEDNIDVPVKATRKRKVENSDDEFVLEDSRNVNDSEADSVDDEEDIDTKPLNKKRKCKVNSDDDEYVPEDRKPTVAKTARSAKTAKLVKSITVKKVTPTKKGTVKEKPVRKARVTKKIKSEDLLSNMDVDNEEIANTKKALAKRTTKSTVKAKAKKDALLNNESENLHLEEEKPAKKKVAVKRKLKASGDVEDEEQGSKSTASKSKKMIKPNDTYWSDEGLLAEMCSCEKYVAWNFIKLINSDNTIPFIARYRKEMVQNYEAEKLREMKQAYENIVEIHQKAETIINKIEKLKKMTPELKKSIYCCKSLEELDLIYSPYKVGSKGTKAEKAKKLGLETPALAVLNGDFDGNLVRFVDAGKTELNNVAKVTDGIQHIIADVIAKDTAVLETLQELVKNTRILFESTKTKQAETIDQFDKYETYFSYSCDIKFVKPHAVLAINRGEAHKVLSVNVKLNDWLQNKLFEFCKRKWLSQGSYSQSRSHLFQLSFEDSFKRLIKPFIVRSIRTQLNQSAEIASIQVFASNLKQLLLVPPMHGAVIMAVDPGYSHGCKVAVIDTNGNVLATDTLYIKFNKNANVAASKDINAVKLRDMVIRHRCELVAIGNGTACRETETYMSDLIQNQWFEPLNVCYTIISEQGASIYSCSAEAKKEFPDLDPNVVSAISLARRLQDPLSELVKIEPKHLGVGMYQHDVPEKQLTSTLNEVVSECVSFVGVDINCASQAMLRRLAGLTDATAANVVKYRTEHGGFTCREDLRKVKGIGEKRFEQCAGFVRISYTESNKGKHNPLDSTWIHPEAYDIARKFARDAGVDLADLGKDRFIAKVNSYIGSRSCEGWAAEYGTSPTTMGLIIEAFRLPRDFDLRSKLSKPLFKKGIQSLDDLASGTVLTGKVNNVTHFGCFVDIGLDRAGLIHTSKLRGTVVKLNDKVNVRVMDVDKARKRVGLELIEVLEY